MATARAGSLTAPGARVSFGPVTVAPAAGIRGARG